MFLRRESTIDLTNQDTHTIAIDSRGWNYQIGPFQDWGMNATIQNKGTTHIHGGQEPQRQVFLEQTMVRPRPIPGLEFPGDNLELWYAANPDQTRIVHEGLPGDNRVDVWRIITNGIPADYDAVLKGKGSEVRIKSYKDSQQTPQLRIQIPREPGALFIID